MCRATYISFAAWCGLVAILVVLWRWLTYVQIPPAIVNKFDVTEIHFALDLVGIVLTGVLYALVLAVLVKVESTLRMRRAAYISFAIGFAIAAMLAVAGRAIWPLVLSGRVPLELVEHFSFIDYLWPAGILLSDFDPLAPLNMERAVAYSSTILLN